MAGNDDLIRQLMAQSGASSSAGSSSYALPVPQGMGDLRQRMLAAAAQPDYVPGDMSSIYSDKSGGDGGGGQQQRLRPLEMQSVPQASQTPQVKPEAMFDFDPNLKVKDLPDSRDEAIRKAREALAKAGAAAKTPPAPAGAAPVTPTETQSQFEGQHTQNPGGAADRESFLRTMTPLALQIAKETGLDPRLVLAQAALESGWGAHAPQFNYFGIKGPGQTLDTTEVIDGKEVKTKADFRAYKSAEESAKDYAKFIKDNPRYAAMLKAQGLEAQIAALGQSGYATDPNYAQKIANIAKTLNLDGSTTPSPTPAKPVVVTSATAPATPGTRVGEHQNGWYWNGTAWEPGPGVKPAPEPEPDTRARG